MSVTSGTKTESGVGETVRVVVHALLIALVIRTFLFQPFNIPSGSMKATLLVGDYLFVSKYSYGYSHYSIPLSPPLFSGRIFGSEPSRGDIVVFRLPKDDTTASRSRPIACNAAAMTCCGEAVRSAASSAATGVCPTEGDTASVLTARHSPNDAVAGADAAPRSGRRQPADRTPNSASRSR